MSYKICPICNRNECKFTENNCDDCEVGLIHAYENNRRAGKTHEQALDISWPKKNLDQE